VKGKILKDRYEIIELIDSGGMGIVYKGLDKKTKKFVAIKVLKPDYANNSEFVMRFKREAKAASSLIHRNIVRMLDSGMEDNVYFIIQEYIEGKTLKNMILENGVLDYQRAIRIMTDICSAMEYAHDNGLVHRDIKPQNILMDKDGKVKVTDFGIAKDISSSTLTNMDSGILGSVHYFSPEQAKGDNADIRSDIYSLGIVFYEMVTGLLPFNGDTSIAIAIKHINDTVRPPKEVNDRIPRSVNDIILKATRKDLALRYQTAGEFKTDLLRAQIKPGGKFVRLKHDKESKRIKNENNRPRRNILFLLLMTFLVLAILATVFLMASSWFFDKEKQDTVNVPKLTGMTEVDALNEIAKIGLKIEKQYEYSDNVKESIVISQQPKAGSSISKNDSVTIVISQGKILFEAPSLIDSTLDKAKQTLEEEGLILGQVTYEESDAPEGYIISQNPEASGTITRGESVSVVVSGIEGQTIVSIPYLVGSDLKTAAKLLLNSGIKRFVIYEDDSNKPEGTILTQRPKEGEQHPSGELVSVWISRFKEKKYTADPAKITIVINENDMPLLLVLEENIGGVRAQYKIVEGAQKKGKLTIPLNLKSRVKGKLTVVAYIGNTEVERKVLTFE
jgi:serine/threonine-protein kinase